MGQARERVPGKMIIQFAVGGREARDVLCVCVQMLCQLRLAATAAAANAPAPAKRAATAARTL